MITHKYVYIYPKNNLHLLAKHQAIQNLGNVYQIIEYTTKFFKNQLEKLYTAQWTTQIGILRQDILGKLSGTKIL